MSEISQTMQELSKEMTKAGIMEEMMEDTMAMSEDEVSVRMWLYILITSTQIFSHIHSSGQNYSQVDHNLMCYTNLP